MKGNAKVAMCVYSMGELWSELSLENKISYRQEELKRVDDNNKNKGVMWLYHMFLGVD